MTEYTNEEIRKSVNGVARKSVYKLVALDVHKKTDLDWQKEFETAKAQGKLWEGATPEMYRWEQLRASEKNDYVISEKTCCGYYDEKKHPLDILRANTADISEGGRMTYAVLQKIPLNCMHTWFFTTPDHIRVFKLDTEGYDHMPHGEYLKSLSYKELDRDDEIAKILKAMFGGK